MQFRKSFSAFMSTSSVGTNKWHENKVVHYPTLAWKNYKNMAVNPRLGKLRGSVKRNLLWTSLRISAKANGIAPGSLRRVREYLNSKFDRPRDDSQAAGRFSTSQFPGIRSIPVYDGKSFAWVQLLEKHASSIRDEYLALRQKGLLKPHPQNLLEHGTWNTYYFSSNGLRFDDHCEQCPITSSVIDRIDGAGQAGQSYFSVMSGGTHVKAHRGPTNTRIRCHLGLVVPDSSVIRVEDERLNWQELGCIVFDDSFEHEVWNPDTERAVLIIDLWHPDLTQEERWALMTISSLSRRNRSYRRRIKENR